MVPVVEVVAAAVVVPFVVASSSFYVPFLACVFRRSSNIRN